MSHTTPTHLEHRFSPNFTLAELTVSQAADRAVVHLVLSPPVIHAESILHDL